MHKLLSSRNEPDAMELLSRPVHRHAVATALLLGALLGAGSAVAQSFPARPIRMVVPFSPGGPTDLMARAVGTKAEEFLGQPITLDFRPGATAIVGTEAVANAAPDGYTLLMAPLSAVAINPVVYKTLPYNVTRDLAAITEVLDYGQYLLIHGGVQAGSVADLVALARKNPGKITYASTGGGSPAHFGGVMLEDMAGIRMVHVPYKGSSQGITDLLAERVDFLITSLASAPTFIKSGKLKVLAYTGEKRSALYPDIPTVAEQGYPGYWLGTYYSIWTRAGTPAQYIARMTEDFNRALKDPKVRSLLEAQDFQVLSNGSPAIVEKRVADETKRWGKLAKQANIQFD